MGWAICPVAAQPKSSRVTQEQLITHTQQDQYKPFPNKQRRKLSDDMFIN
jgi:hypothetical protein